MTVKVAPTRGLFNTREREGGYEKDLDLHHHNLRTGLSFDWIGMGTDGKGYYVTISHLLAQRKW